MLLSRLRRENYAIDEVTIHQLSITDGNTSQKNFKKDAASLSSSLFTMSTNARFT